MNQPVRTPTEEKTANQREMESKEQHDREQTEHSPKQFANQAAEKILNEAKEQSTKLTSCHPLDEHVTPRSEPPKHHSQKQPPVHPSEQAEDPATEKLVNNETNLVLNDLDVVVGVGKQCYSFQSYPGNVGLNNEIMQALPAISKIKK